MPRHKVHQELVTNERIARTLDALDSCRLLLAQLDVIDDEEAQEDREYVERECTEVLAEWRALN